MGNYYLVGGSESLFGARLAHVQQRFVRAIQSYLPDDQVVWVPLASVRSGLATQVGLVRSKYPNVFVVTLSHLYFPIADASVSCNRVVDTQGRKLGLAERPGSPPLCDQICVVMKEADGRTIAVVDDTFFHGETIAVLREQGLRIDIAVEYFSESVTEARLQQEGTSVYTVSSLNGYLDVLPLHDFLPVTPLSGKVVGHRGVNGIELMTHESGGSYSLPYLMPYITAKQVSQWASIPEVYAEEFSQFALTMAIQVMELAGDDRFVYMAQAVCHPMRVSWPYLPEGYPKNITVENVLRRALHLSI
ncbi:hypothetical protein C4564_00430 [Candidatus Microgenomates bacterium]|nr:MAG: hypothetical protein C4564_00430 [Candidatus Microgenomates bacterium]